MHIYSQGNEGVEVKEGSINNIIEHNTIHMQKDPTSGGESVLIWDTSGV